jgi:hypothetical protein
VASEGLIIGAADIGREVRSCYASWGRFLGEASRGCFYFLHVDVTCVGSLRPQTESMQAEYGLVWYVSTCAAQARPITPSNSQLAAAGRPFCVSTDILGHGPWNGGSGHWWELAAVQRAELPAGGRALKQRHDVSGRDEGEGEGQDGRRRRRRAGQPVESSTRAKLEFEILPWIRLDQTGSDLIGLDQIGRWSACIQCSNWGQRQD